MVVPTELKGPEVFVTKSVTAVMHTTMNIASAIMPPQMSTSTQTLIINEPVPPIGTGTWTCVLH